MRSTIKLTESKVFYFVDPTYQNAYRYLPREETWEVKIGEFWEEMNPIVYKQTLGVLKDILDRNRNSALSYSVLGDG